MVKLTQTVQKGGCAAKVAATELRSILNQVQFPNAHAELLVDGRHFDDAAIYKVNDELSLVQTLDFFTPILDDPFMFGQVAAANALSDVYAMGGLPKTAMVILAYPIATFEKNWVVALLQGVADKVKEAQANIVGGHTIDDDTLKLGLSVTGYCDTRKYWTNQNCKDGDVLILTKCLGTGTHTAALKRQFVNESEIMDVVNSMRQLNSVPSMLNSKLYSAVHAATDITGFGFAGHSFNMAKASDKLFDIKFSKLPLFEGTLESLDRGYLTKAHRTNRDYIKDSANLSALQELEILALCDPQTSGGLLLSVDPIHADEVLKEVKTQFPHSCIIGDVKSKDGKEFLRFS
ncbi:MAG: selenide, water dikinase SelD [Bdellovibrio sp. 28-41-41]|nr:MAG: selenide, water dikinase SelD [Bdellovibrio sp. 28-41-41]